MKMLEIDRKELDKAIEGLEGMFSATEQVLADYEAEKKVLEDRGSDLEDQLTKLQQTIAKKSLEREETKDTSKYVKLSKQLEGLTAEMNLIGSLQEQLKDDFKALKVKYMPIIRNSYNKDMAKKREFDVNETVEYVRYFLVKGIADYAEEIRKQDAKIMPIIRDQFLDDTEIMENNRSFARNFDFDRTKLSYSNFNNTVISKNNILWACGGNIAPEITKPKEVE